MKTPSRKRRQKHKKSPPSVLKDGHRVSRDGVYVWSADFTRESDVEALKPGPREPRKKKGANSKNSNPGKCRRPALLDREALLDIYQRYTAWVEGGRKASESPIRALVKQYGCHRNFPARLAARVKASGSIDRKKNPGRPPVFHNEVWGSVAEIVREKRKDHRIPSAREIRNELLVMGYDDPPAERTITKKLRELGFQKVSVTVKPMLKTTMMAERLEFAKKYHRHHSH